MGSQTSAQLGRPDFGPEAGADLGPAAPTCSAAPSPRITRAPGEVRASRPPLRRPPLSDEQGRGQSGTYPDLRLQRPKTSIQPRRRPRATDVGGPRRAGDAGGAAADSTARPRSACGAVPAGCTWGNFGLSCRLRGRRHPGLSAGPRGLRAPRLVSPGPGSPHAPRPLTLQCPERRARPVPAEGPRAAGACPGAVARHPGLCGGSGLAPARRRVSPPSPPRGAGGCMRTPAAAGCLQGSRHGPRGRGASRARERAGRRVRLGRVSAGASGGRAVGGAG